jgi:RHS repeat-associated protein
VKRFFLSLILLMYSISSQASCYINLEPLYAECALSGIPVRTVGCTMYGESWVGIGCDPFPPNSDYMSNLTVCGNGRRPSSYSVCPQEKPNKLITPVATQTNSCTKGSIILTDTQTLLESVQLTGVPYSLYYSSEKVPGRTWYKVKIPVTADSFSSSSTTYTENLKISIAGQTHNLTLTGSAGLNYEFEWDGKDNLGNPVLGSQTAYINLYETSSAVIYAAPGFPDPVHFYPPVLNKQSTKSDVGPVEYVTRNTGYIYPEHINSTYKLGSVFGSDFGLGGWDFDVHHSYDSIRGILYLGNGTSLTTYAQSKGSEFWILSSDRSEVYVFDSNYRHIKTKDALDGHSKLIFNYNSSNKLISIVDTYGNSTTIQYVAGKVVSITSPYGQVTDIDTDTNGFISSITNPASESYAMSYSSSGSLLTFEKPNNVISTMTYDGDGKLLSDSSSAGSSTTLSKSLITNGYRVAETSELGRITNHDVTYTGLSVTRIDSYPDNSLSTTAEDTVNKSMSSTHNYKSGYSTNSVSDVRFGNPFKMITAGSIFTANTSLSFTKSENAILTDINDPFSYTTLSKSYVANGKTTQSSFNKSTGIETTTSPLGKVSSTTKNGHGDIVTSSFASFTPVNISYDSNGRVSQVAQGVNRVLDYSYNTANGLLESVENSLGQITSFTYDLAGRVLTQTLPDSRVVTYTYDANSNLASITPPGKAAHEFSYNGFDLLASYIPPTIAAPSTVSSTYYYNDDRDLIQITRPDGQTIVRSFGATTGALNSETSSTGVRNYGYSAGSLTYATSEDGISRYPTIRNGVLTGDYVMASPLLYYMTNTFNTDLLLTQEALVVGSTSSTISFTYDNDGGLTSAGNETLARSSTTGLLSQTTLGSINQSFTYSSNFGELSSSSSVYGSTALYQESFTRDNLGRISTKTQQYGSGPVDQFEYTYDSSGRLTDVELNSSIVSSYAYDTNSNRTSLTSGSTTTSATYDAQDRLLTYGTKSFTYNLNGELTSMTDSATSTTTNYVYDSYGNLKSVTLPSKTINYKVDAFNRRTTKLNGSTIDSFFVWNTSNQLVGITDASGVMVSRFVYGSKPHVPDYMKIGTNEFQIISNHLGSPVMVVNSATGVIEQEITYDEFGKIVSDTAPGFTPFGFAGCLYDVETKLCRFGARDYDASIGRWLSKDPIRFDGGDTNLYGYVFNDPINFIDPEGTLAFLAVPVAYEVGFFFGATYNKLVSNVDYSESYNGYSLIGKVIDGINPILGFFSDKDVYKLINDKVSNQREKDLDSKIKQSCEGK